MFWLELLYNKFIFFIVAGSLKYVFTLYMLDFNKESWSLKKGFTSFLTIQRRKHFDETFWDETLTIKSKFWVPPPRNPSPSASEAEEIAKSYQDDKSW